MHFGSASYFSGGDMPHLPKTYILDDLPTDTDALDFIN
jgi:hypothetical protein